MRDLGERFLEFGADLVAFTSGLSKTSVKKHVSDQLMRSGTAVGAIFEEAHGAESRADFIHKLQLTFKESREAVYWLRLIEKSGAVKSEELTRLIDESLQIRAILTQAVITAKSK